MKLSSSHIIEQLENRLTTQPDFVLYRFADYKDGEFKFQDCSIKQIYKKSLEMANALKEKGVRKGDRAIIFSMQDFGTVYAVLGCMMAGIVFTVLPPPLDESKLTRFISVLKSCKPKALISNYALEKGSGVSVTGRLLKEAFFDVISLKRIYTDRLAPYSRRDVIVPQEPEDLVYLQYTSGSTSEPKGVRVLRKNLMFQMEQCNEVYDFRQSSLGTWVPFFHNLGLVITVLMPICVVGPVVYHMNTIQFLENPKLWIKMLSDYKLTLTVGPGSAFDACTRIFTEEEAAQYDLSNTTHLMNGSEFVSPETIARFSRMFHAPYLASAPGYGLGECVCLASVASQDYKVLRVDFEQYQDNRIVLSDAKDAKEIVSLGKPVKDLTIVAANPKTKKAYGELRIGEICIQGPTVADGYWGNIPDNKNFHFRLQNKDGDFYRTGDLGFLYEGNVYITGRLKEMFIVNGHNVYLNDILLCLQQKVPSLTGAAIVCFTVEQGTKEQVIACVEASADFPFTKAASRINSVMAAQFGFSFYDIVFVPAKSLPRTDNNKLQTVKARRMYANHTLPILYSVREHAQSAPLPSETGPAESKTEIRKDETAKPETTIVDDIFTQVKSTFDRVLNIDHYNIHDSFLELGGDSLTGFELLTKIEQKFGIKLDLRELLLDASVSGISDYIHRILNGGKTHSTHVDLIAECHLPDEIRPEQDYKVTADTCRRIFLTGATGFLGSNLIRSFIETYPHDGLKIYCHVRAADEETGMLRIKEKMQHFRCWKPEYELFIHPVPGDLTRPLLGMEPELYEKLSEEVDAVFHNGALLNFVYPYQYLKRTNVTGTAEALRFACKNKAKYFHYVSSYSVFDTPDFIGKKILEEDPLNNGEGFSLAYSETKWVSEHLVSSAAKRGLKTIIYRPGDITGGENGIWNLEDMVSRLIVGCIQLQCVPPASYQMQMTPVDYISDAMANISRQELAVGRHFNLINPKPLSLRQLVNSIRRKGYRVHYVPYGLWKKRLHACKDTNVLSILECLFEPGTSNNPGILRHFTGKNSVYDTSNAKALLKNTNITCPPVDDRFIHLYLNYFHKCGYI